MKTKRFATEAEAIEFAQAVNKAAGCPIYGVNHGIGRHVDRELSKTVQISEYVFVSKDAEGEKYAYLVTAEVEVYAGETETVDGKEIAIEFVGVKDDYEYPTKGA